MKKKTVSKTVPTTVPKKAASRPAKRTASADTKTNALGPVQDVQVRIAARAHELYEQRGCLDGYHLHDWLEAEREILGHPVVMDKSSERI